ncbi:hypothetical protein [Singulisphaera acidiphila]|uniref:Uncharacterized protein n=1 Tax=Singulisphaera acidiphila (strain ATCC BAA-1392 / DSM 18658 / VKM B-2454 / MOB10) TaxID=886293 RepID=L0D955_SINAD|nr:hypothetical protein [Singulisphaera acidiphila]AGA25914.1 hypothetical protein Sinac_1535 [Singulisphaera acidiphila DSM 18658]
MGIRILLATGGLALIVAPRWAPVCVGLALATAVVPWLAAWRGARGTELRPAVAWAGLALLIGLISQGLAGLEPLNSGRPMAGHLVYLTVLASFAALISVLNARRPGGGAWAILMALLVLVFLIPWLEGPGWARKAQGLSRLRLDAPWSLFYVLVVIAGVTNYLPTRYGRAAAWLGLGFVCEYFALTRSEWKLNQGARLWSVVPWSLAVAAWTAFWSQDRAGRPRAGLDATWLWFRDHWGVVWALRLQERFNRTAESLGWPLRLAWDGIVPAIGSTDEAIQGVVPAADTTLKGLLRRFADLERIEAARGSVASDSCQARDGE